MTRQLHSGVPTSETPGCRLQRLNIQMRDLCHPMSSIEFLRSCVGSGHDENFDHTGWLATTMSSLFVAFFALIAATFSRGNRLTPAKRRGADIGGVIPRPEGPDSFATRTPCTWMHSTTGRGRDCQSLDSDVLANKESASTRSAISVPQECGLIRTEFSVGTTKISGYPGELQFAAVLLKHVPLAHSTTPTDATMTPVKLVPGSKGTAAPL
jgi:hypothetical protein